MKINWKKIGLWGSALVPVAVMLFVLASPASAAIVNCGNNDGGTAAEGCTFKDLFTSAANLVNYLLSGAAVVAVGGVVYGGYLMVTSAGNQSKTETGKKAVTNSLIGLAIILLAFLMVKSLFSILGFQGNPLENPGALEKGQGFQLINGREVVPLDPNGGGNGGNPIAPSGTAQALAQQLLDTAGVGCFYAQHVGGHAPDGATARDNIVDTAAGRPAKRSSYGGAPGGSTPLDARMLQALLSIHAAGYTSMCPVTAIAGSEHSSDSSAHYAGKAFDLDHTTNADAILAICRRAGAVSAVNEGNHLHCRW